MRKTDAILIEQAKNFNPGTYDVGIEAVAAVTKMHNHSRCDLFYHAYAMGFIKGQRAATSKLKAENTSRSLCDNNDRAFEREGENE